MKDQVKLHYAKTINKLYEGSELKREYLLTEEISSPFIERLFVEIKKVNISRPKLKISKDLFIKIVNDFTTIYARQIIGNKEKKLRSEEGKEVAKLQAEYWEQHKPVKKVEEEIKEMLS